MLEKFEDFIPDPKLSTLEQSLSAYSRETLDSCQAVILDADGNIFLFTGNTRNHLQIVKEWLTNPYEQVSRKVQGTHIILKMWAHDGLERHIVFNYERQYTITELGTVVLLEVSNG